MVLNGVRVVKVQLERHARTVQVVELRLKQGALQGVGQVVVQGVCGVAVW